MSRSRTVTATSAFGIWLDAQMRQADIQQKQVASRSGLGQSTIAGYLTGARNPNNAGLVHRIVQGVLPDDAPDGVAAQVLRDGLLAAGFAATPLPPAVQLVREKLAQEDVPESALTADQMDGLITEVEAITVFRIHRALAEAQKERGKSGAGQTRNIK